MEDLATIRRIKLEQCVQLATFQTDATQVKFGVCDMYNMHKNDDTGDVDDGWFV